MRLGVKAGKKKERKSMMPNMKNCPFCNGSLVYDARKTAIWSIETKCHCDSCGMQFTYNQEFAYSKKSRVPIDEPFEKVWNSRVSEILK